MVSLLAALLISELQVAVQEKTSDPFPPQRIGYLGQWGFAQRRRTKGNGQALSKEDEDKVCSTHHTLSQ